jgi:hypothetical protein
MPFPSPRLVKVAQSRVVASSVEVTFDVDMDPVGVVDITNYSLDNGASPNPTPSPTVNDTFTRANTAGPTPGTADTGQVWVSEGGGSWGIDTNRLYRSSADNAENNVVIESSIADGMVESTLTVFAGGSQNYGVVVRETDFANFILLNFNDGEGLRFYKKVGGVYVAISSPVAYSPASGDLWKVVLNGSSIKGYINGVLKLSITDAFNQTATRHGQRGFTVGTSRWDDFKVTPAAIQTIVGTSKVRFLATGLAPAQSYTVTVNPLLEDTMGNPIG